MGRYRMKDTGPHGRHRGSNLRPLSTGVRRHTTTPVRTAQRNVAFAMDSYAPVAQPCPLTHPCVHDPSTQAWPLIAALVHPGPLHDSSTMFPHVRMTHPPGFAGTAPDRQRLKKLKAEMFQLRATPPMWLKADLKTFDMSVGGPLGAKFDVIYIDPVSHRHPPHTPFSGGNSSV